jgi:RNA polymerase subunit RPABC4/transcription elongation factor Spt4
MTRSIVTRTERGEVVIGDDETGTLWVLVDPDRQSHPEIIHALSVRNRATMEGECPECGGREITVPRSGNQLVVHEEDCIAGDTQLQKLIERVGGLD